VGLFVEAASNSRESTTFTLLIPLIHPRSRADRVGALAQGFAAIFVTLLGTYEPFVVAVPTVNRLVLTREAFVTGSCANLLDLVEERRLLLGELWRRRSEKLKTILSFMVNREGRADIITYFAGGHGESLFTCAEIG
jgi:hypothetical protein